MALPFIFLYLVYLLFNASPVSIKKPQIWKLYMAQKLDDSELVSFKELLMANSIQVDTAVEMLIEKGFFTEQEFFTKLKQVQAKYQQNESVS